MVRFKERSQLAIQERIQKEMRKHNVDGLLLTEATNIYYATGHYSAFQKMSLVPGYAVAVCPAEDEFTVIMPDFEILPGGNQCPNCKIEITEMGCFVDHIEKLTGRPAPKERLATASTERTILKAIDILKKIKPDAVIGIQFRMITVEVMKILTENEGGLIFVDCEEILNKARMIKTPWEIDVLREAAQINEMSMNMAAKKFYPGMSLAEAYHTFQTVATSVNSNIFDMYTIVTADEYSTIFNIAPDAVLREGSVIRLDGGPRYLGYTTDICRIFSLGEPNDEQKRIYEAVAAGYRRELEMIGPGVKVADIFNEVQDTVRKAGIPHYIRGHVGHSTAVNPSTEEYPYISPLVDEVLQPGMVMCPEVPYYSHVNGPLVCEDMILITEKGFEKFTNDPMRIVRL